MDTAQSSTAPTTNFSKRSIIVRQLVFQLQQLRQEFAKCFGNDSKHYSK
jgi:hypothetical protein